MQAVRANGKLSFNWNRQWISPRRASSQIGSVEEPDLARWSCGVQVQLIVREEDLVGEFKCRIRKGVYTHSRAVVAEAIDFVCCRGSIRKRRRTRRDDRRCLGSQNRWDSSFQLDGIDGTDIKGGALQVLGSRPASNLRASNGPIHGESGIGNGWGKRGLKRSNISNWGHTGVSSLVGVHLTISDGDIGCI